jgi:ABC-type multidrug transport system fused ATPase/permease subunit
MGGSLFRAINHLYVWRGTLQASRALFEEMTFRILRTPLRWVDTVPVGRIINRFTADFATFDSSLGDDLAYLCLAILDLVAIGVAAYGLRYCPIPTSNEYG